MTILLNILKILGALGLFMYGMKVMSESLQKVAGFGMRRNLALIARKKFKGIFTGGIITSIIQSSTATTIMIVSFVNAGLLTLTESTGLIMGANIGTTVTAWLVAVLGLKLNIGVITLPLIGIAFPFYFSKNKKLRYWCEFIIGFALIFIGLEFIKNIFPDIQSSPEVFDFVQKIAVHGFGSLFLFLLLGLIITSIIQSSSVASALTLILCIKGWIGFEHAAAMILGENIGTTVTANIAAIMANKTAKKAALFHTLFNIAGIIWALPLLHFITLGIDKIMLVSAGKSPYVDITTLPIALAIFHTGFNTINTILFARFSDYFLILTGKVFRTKDEEKETFGLKFLNQGIMSTSEISLIQVKKEVFSYGIKSAKMFELVRKLFAETNHANFNEIYEEIKKAEKYSDNLEEQISLYLTRLAEGELTPESSFTIRIMLKVVDEIESICDAIFNISKALNKKRKNKVWFTQNIRDNINEMFNVIETAFDQMNQNLQGDYKSVDMKNALNIEKKINKYRKELHKEHVGNVDKHNYKYEAGILYNDLFNRCERLGDLIFNVSEMLSEIRNVRE